ncbi:MAG: tyrosine--tRNA ligase [Candidatus Geothermarchaeales archaeon]
MDVERRLDLIGRPPTEEILTVGELRELMETEVPLRHYIGFEISGMIHLGTGLMCMLKVKDFLDAGVDCTVFLADWHTWINRKLGGDLELIKRVAGGYFKEGMKATLKAVGGDPEKVKFVLGSDLYHHNDEYWQTLIEVSQNLSLSRVRRSITIMGRKLGEKVNFAQLIYPSMQISDIFILGVNLAHAGVDQRRAHVGARSVALKLKIKPLSLERLGFSEGEGRKIKPIAVHHHLILGLQRPPIWPITPDVNVQELWSDCKMSKSKEATCVFIHDSPEEIRAKIHGGFCPEREVVFNPMLDWVRHIVLRGEGDRFSIHRADKYGGDVEFQSYGELEEAFREGRIHPLDLKNALADHLIDLLEPVRKHFEKHRDLIEIFSRIKITR